MPASLSWVAGTTDFLRVAPAVPPQPRSPDILLFPCPSSTEKPLCPQEEALLCSLASHFSCPSWGEPDPAVPRRLPVSPKGHALSCPCTAPPAENDHDHDLTTLRAASWILWGPPLSRALRGVSLHNSLPHCCRLNSDSPNGVHILIPGPGNTVPVLVKGALQMQLNEGS